ncbi:hypothetical protein QBC42DRAFT_252082 [Cladorrhinum samala]|uniref:Uncharacterized protein n=1 Tax=Cladorrhinum samala TaxID=585594 RepID=A0AAV9HPT4_9PEZI|nr:hypothetical protein QBC42DRAFT_252082 [Cladorrhinum samala]
MARPIYIKKNTRQNPSAKSARERNNRVEKGSTSLTPQFSRLSIQRILSTAPGEIIKAHGQTSTVPIANDTNWATVIDRTRVVAARRPAVPAVPAVPAAPGVPPPGSQPTTMKPWHPFPSKEPKIIRSCFAGEIDDHCLVCFLSPTRVATRWREYCLQGLVALLPSPDGVVIRLMNPAHPTVLAEPVGSQHEIRYLEVLDHRLLFWNFCAAMIKTKIKSHPDQLPALRQRWEMFAQAFTSPEPYLRPDVLTCFSKLLGPDFDGILLRGLGSASGQTRLDHSNPSQDVLYILAGKSNGYRKMLCPGLSIIQTSGENLLCGVRAIVGSMTGQQPWLPQPTEGELYEIITTDEQIAAFHAESQMDELEETSNFRIDLLQASLRIWGECQGLTFDLRLQVLLGDTFQLIACPFRDAAKWVDIFIHNNDNPHMAHYSGLWCHTTRGYL